jgi:hypothetical protein
MSSSCVPIVMYLNKCLMFCKLIPICACPKTEIFSKAHLKKLDFFGTRPKTNICASIKTTLLICTQLYEIMHKFFSYFIYNQI